MCFSLSLHDQIIEFGNAGGLDEELEILFGLAKTDDVGARHAVAITKEQGGRFALQLDGTPSQAGVVREDLLDLLQDEVVHALIVDMASAVVVHAGAVALNDRAIILAGPTGSGKTSLAAWFVANGCQYISDEVVALVDDGTGVVGFPRAMVHKGGPADRPAMLAGSFAANTIRTGSRMMIGPKPERVATRSTKRCGLIIFPEFESGAPLRISAVTAAQTGLRLMGCNLNSRNLPGAGFGEISALARDAPAFVLHYGDFDQLDGVVDVLVRFLLDAERSASDARRFLSAFPDSALAERNERAAVPKRQIPIPTPRRPPSRLTIGMATYDDYDGVYFTVQALRLYHPDILEQVNFLVVDNHPDGPCAAPLKQLDTLIPNYRYVPVAARSGTAVRNVVFDEADSEFVLCMDCHVCIVSGAVKRLLYYFEANPDTRDLLQGPLLYDDLQKVGSHLDPQWRAGMFGCWGGDPRANEPDGAPFDIPMQGLGLFACRRAAWPDFNREFRGFGGEEGYIHEKFRLAGGRTLCLPFLRWIHRFNRPFGAPYRNIWDDRMRNYLIGFREVGWSADAMVEHFRELLGREEADRILESIEVDLAAG